MAQDIFYLGFQDDVGISGPGTILIISALEYLYSYIMKRGKKESGQDISKRLRETIYILAHEV